jgi:glycosyltransferase involved in cell wall biosynthesis
MHGSKRKSMRILYVSSDFGVPVYGHKGASIHLRSMARAFAALGHEVHVVSPAVDPVGNLDFTIPASAPVTLAAHEASLAALRQLDQKLGPLESGHGARVAQEVRNLLYNQELARSADRLRELAPDFVYERYALFGFGGLELARALAVPHLLEVNAPLCLEHERARGLHLGDLARAFERRAWCETGAMLAVSEPLRARALELGAVPGRVHVVPNGVDAARFAVPAAAGAACRAELGLGAGPVLGFVGSLKAWHGTDVLLRAFALLRARLPQAQLLLVGDGPTAEALRRDAVTLGVHAAVHFTGAVEHARIPVLLAAMDVAVAPYLPAEDFYFSPIKVYEYMAAGRPVVASRLGEMSALAAAGLLLAVEPGDAGALAVALERLLEAPHAAARLAEFARDWVGRERTWEANARRAVALALESSAAPA